MQNVSRGKRRCCLTHVAFLCDRPDVQPLLPQVLIGNEATFLVGLLPTLNLERPPSVRLLRQKSAWNCGETCARIIRMLGATLAPYTDAVQPILLLDAVRIHTTPQVLAACNAMKIWPVLVPAKLTWLLQPLDTDAFLPFKRRLRAAYQDACARSADGTLTTRQFLPCVYDAVNGVLSGRCWETTFEQNGFGSNQTNISPYVMRQLQIDAPPSILAVRPTLPQLVCCFPKRTKVPTAALWRQFDRVPTATPAPSAPVEQPFARSRQRCGTCPAGAAYSRGAPPCREGGERQRREPCLCGHQPLSKSAFGDPCAGLTPDVIDSLPHPPGERGGPLSCE